MKLHLVLYALCLLGLFAGCDDKSQQPSAAPLVPIQIGTRTFQCEIAATDRTREYGLMNRHSLPPDRGMLFVFPDEQVRGFWMQNTYIPLDILFLNHSGKIVAIRHMKPLDETITSSDAPAMYAIELNQGAAQEANIKEGDTIQLPAIGAK